MAAARIRRQHQQAWSDLRQTTHDLEQRLELQIAIDQLKEMRDP